MKLKEILFGNLLKRVVLNQLKISKIHLKIYRMELLKKWCKLKCVNILGN